MRSEEPFIVLDNIDTDEIRLCIRVAKLYYEGGLTQSQIGQKMNISRVSVHRILKRATDLGLVKIMIYEPEDSFIEIENQLILKYDLRDAVIVPDPAEGMSLYAILAKGAGQWLEKKLTDGLRVGVGLGRTISHLPDDFHPVKKTDCVFTEVVGGASEHSGGVTKYNITSKMAELAGGRAELFYAPNTISDASLYKQLVQESSIKNALNRARSCDVVLQSIGVVNENYILYVEESMTKEELGLLSESGAVGDTLGRYFDRDGQQVHTFMDNRVIGIGMDDLKKIPWSVVVAGGESKNEVLRAALKTGCFNVVVTTQSTGSALLAESDQ